MHKVTIALLGESDYDGTNSWATLSVEARAESVATLQVRRHQRRKHLFIHKHDDFSAGVLTFSLGQALKT